MKEMNYSNGRIIELLDNDIYKGYHYYILSLGSHPTAYIEIPKNDKLYKVFYMDVDINCHGGLTYSEDHLRISDGTIMNGWFIGWDYAHYGDYIGYEEMFPEELKEFGKKWTTLEIKEECKNVIEQIIKINKE